MIEDSKAKKKGRGEGKGWRKLLVVVYVCVAGETMQRRGRRAHCRCMYVCTMREDEKLYWLNLDDVQIKERLLASSLAFFFFMLTQHKGSTEWVCFFMGLVIAEIRW